MKKIIAVFVSVRLIVKVVLTFKRHKLITILKHILHRRLSRNFLYTAFYILSSCPHSFVHSLAFHLGFFYFSRVSFTRPWTDLRAFSAFFRTSFIILPSCVICVLSPRVSFLFIPSRSMLGMDNPQSEFVIDIATGESENRYYTGVCFNSRITTVYISKYGDPVFHLISLANNNHNTRQIASNDILNSWISKENLELIRDRNQI